VDRAEAQGSTEDTLFIVTLEHGRSIALLGLGDIDGAVASARTAVDLAATTDWTSYHADALMALAPALHARGDEAAATETAMRA
jgi:hypothetical protein